MKNILILLISSLFTLNVFASLQVFPTRIVLSDQQKISNISLRNKGNEKQTYTIKPVFYRMGHDGSMALVKDAKNEERSLVKYLRFSPRKVTLKPGEEQVIRVMLKSVGNLPQADYRAHLRILPNVITETDTGKKSKVAMKMYGRVAVSIGIFYYKGDAKLSAKLSDMKLSRKGKKYNISLMMLNTGDRFLIGNFKLFFTPKDKKEELVAEINGISSYVPKRFLNYDFTSRIKTVLKNGELRLEFIGPKFLESPKISEIKIKI